MCECGSISAILCQIQEFQQQQQWHQPKEDKKKTTYEKWYYMRWLHQYWLYDKKKWFDVMNLDGKLYVQMKAECKSIELKHNGKTD